jgi:hypothetical protein
MNGLIQQTSNMLTEAMALRNLTGLSCQSPQKPYHFFNLSRNGDQRMNPQPYYLIQPDTGKNKVIRLISSGKLPFLLKFGVGK